MTLSCKKEKCVTDYPVTSLGSEYKFQSDVQITSDDATSRIETSVQYIDNAPQDILTFAPVSDTSYRVDEQEQLELSTFLERPIQAHSFSWLTGGLAQSTIKPWELFFDNPAVKNKIANFAFVSCNLHVEIKVNSTPFNYGSLRFAYHPLPKFSPNTLSISTSLDLVCKSQRPGVWISPEENSGGTMILPFFYHKNFLSLNSRTELQDMGEIDILEYVQLRSASGVATSPVSVQIFIHATNVILTGGTVAGVLQSDEGEYDVDPISKPASAVANVANYFTSVPIIGPYAKATEIGASAVSKVAKLFGYTDPPVISHVQPYRSMVFGGLASAEISEPKDKFSLDPKAELTIDPRTTGLEGDDELAIASIVQRPSFLTTFNWANDDLVDQLLFNTLVIPDLREITEETAGAVICYTPVAHIAQLFNNWRGDMIFTFRFVCSTYHKGRVRITWDPIGDIVTNSDTMNTNFTKIIDLSTDREIKLRVPYMQPKIWQQTTAVRDPSRLKVWQTENFSDLSGFNENIGNGTLTVRVLTQLSAPAASAPIECMVFVNGAENLEFANPIDLNRRYSHFAFQADEGVVDNVDVGETGKCDPNKYLVTYGESISSIRTLLRRSVLADTVPMEPLATGNNSDYVVVQYRMNKYPVPPGLNPNGESQITETSFPTTIYSFTKMTPWNWMQSCFVGCRGSMQWRFNVNANGSSPVESIKLVRTLDTLSANNRLTSFSTLNNETYSYYFDFFNRHQNCGMSGISLTNQRTQTSVTTELNMFNQNRFVSSSNFNTTIGLAEDNSDRETYSLLLTFANNGRNDIAGTVIERYVSIGTDFNFFFYLNAPITYYLNEDVTPFTS